MALTPTLNQLGRRAADFLDEKFDIVEVLANFLSTSLVSGVDSDLVGWPYIGFDLNPSVVKESRKLGFPILYGDGSRPSVLQSAGVSSPKAIMIMYKGKKRTTKAVQRLRLAFPGAPIYARAQDLPHLLELKKVGATDAILENAETSLQLGSMLRGFGVMSDDVSFLSKVFRDSMEIQAQDEITAAETSAGSQVPPMKPMQMKASDTNVDSVQVQVKASDSNANSAEILKETDGLGQTEIDSPVNIDNGFVGKAEKAQE
ncbi:unnamed protein product [Arabis nemorensis]|uniref:RCK N-terminal domain-containing protein n=1 Tax=Arabis nemorensis TaxID=586526 RepID=A0A565CQR7_9BRAS|nr:unnamed protein product [Arabis nemorensis]